MSTEKEEERKAGLVYSSKLDCLEDVADLARMLMNYIDEAERKGKNCVIEVWLEEP